MMQIKDKASNCNHKANEHNNPNVWGPSATHKQARDSKKVQIIAPPY